jgi:NDP-sugar pyrophosphorylase family protein
MLFDFAFSSLRRLCADGDACTVVTDTRDRMAASSAAARWGKGAVRQRDAENGLVELRRLVSTERSPWVILSAMSYAAYLDPRSLMDLAEHPAPRRVRAETTSLPLYFLSREALLEALDGATRLDPDAGGCLRSFLREYLPARVRDQADIPGRGFFVDNVMQLWDAHHFLRENMGGSRVERYLEAVSGAGVPDTEACVGEGGYVRDSFISPGAIIHGSVVDSVVFPGVVVRRGAEVRQSVLMTGNRIGAGATVANTLIMPWQPEIGGEAENVGAGAEIGDARHAMQTRNDEFPRQIARGLTLIGMNASVPPRVTIGTGCYIGPGSGGALRSLRRLERGASVR